MMTTAETAMEAVSETGAEPIRKGKKRKKLKKTKKCEREEIMIVEPPLSVNALGPSTKSLKKVEKKQREQCAASVPAVDGVALVKTKKKSLTKKSEKSKERRKKEKNSAMLPEWNEQQMDDVAELGSHKRKHSEKSEDAVALPKKRKKKRKKEKSKITETSPVKEQEMSRENGEKATETTPPGAMDEKSEAATEPKSVQSTTRSFRRVTDEEWLGKKGAWDNSYEATFGSSGWGAKAQQVLANVRGKNFRHEKTKKKRGTYFGGKISADVVNSIKFESDED